MVSVTGETMLPLLREERNDVSDPVFRPLNVGDTQDDDAQVIDSLVQQEANPPTPVVEPIDTPPLPEPKAPTRLTSVRQLVDPAWSSPTLILPADTRRKFLTLRCTSPDGTITDGVVIMSESGGSTTGLGILPHGGVLPLDTHTGAVRVLATGAKAVYVDVWSVTE